MAFWHHTTAFRLHTMAFRTNTIGFRTCTKVFRTYTEVFRIYTELFRIYTMDFWTYTKAFWHHTMFYWTRLVSFWNNHPDLRTPTINYPGLRPPLQINHPVLRTPLQREGNGWGATCLGVFSESRILKLTRMARIYKLIFEDVSSEKSEQEQVWSCLIYFLYGETISDIIKMRRQIAFVEQVDFLSINTFF